MIQGRTLWQLVDGRAQVSPDALFLTDEGKRTMTFAEYRQAAELAAAGLLAMGVGEDTPARASRRVAPPLRRWAARRALTARPTRLDDFLDTAEGLE